jgi:hypothetical protein
MRYLLFGASLAMAFAMGQTALAGPRIPGSPFINRPIPIQPQTPGGPHNNDGQLRVLPTQTELRVESFNARFLGCPTDFSRGDYSISARLPVQTDALRRDEAEIQLLVDGVSQATANLRARDGYVTFSHRVSLPGGAGNHEISFLLNGSVHSEPIAVRHSCTTLAPLISDHQPRQATLPNLAFGDLLYTQLAPIYRRDPPSESQSSAASGSASAATAALLEQRVTLAPRTSFRYPIIVRDLPTLAGRVQFPSNSYCPGEVDAYVSALFAVAVHTSRVADPSPYAQVIAGPFDTPVRYVDTIDGPRWVSGEAVGTDIEILGTPLPQGYQWIVFHAGLECTRDGILELRFDPGGALSESREDDNVLRIRYATVAQ